VNSVAGGATTGSIVQMPNNPGQEIKWGCYLSRNKSLRPAIREAVSKVLDSLGGAAVQPSLALVFVSSVHGAEFEQVIPILRELVPSLKHVFGCSVRVSIRMRARNAWTCCQGHAADPCLLPSHALLSINLLTGAHE
jgi:hypothetical protein